LVDFYNLTLIAALYGVIELGAILLAIDAVMRPRSSQAAIAWSLSLVTMPLLAIPIYLIFGRTRFEGYAEAVREKQTLVEDKLQAWFHQMSEKAADLNADSQAVKNLVPGLTGVPFTCGNRVDLLVDGEATYKAMLDAIARAESYVLVQFYIVKDGSVGQQFSDALIKKAQSGIRVYFLYDEIGCWKLPEEYLETLRQNSIQITGFKTTQGRRNRFQINFRNHRKFLIVDGRSAFIGGHNLADEYLEYRDTHVKIEGPAAQQIQLTFLKDWYWATRQIPDVATAVKSAAKDLQHVAVVNTGPADTMSNCSVLFATLFNAARNRLWLTSPYFVPDDVMVRALQAAAIRGVDVRIILPGKADHFLVDLASYTYFSELMNCGVKFFRYHERFLHQKVVLVDNYLSGVGTVNLDNRSLYLNFEATALIADGSFAKKMEAMLLQDFTLSKEVGSNHFDDKPIYFRVASRIARLVSPIL
jgi:cardiolipin synthase